MRRAARKFHMITNIGRLAATRGDARVLDEPSASGRDFPPILCAMVHDCATASDPRPEMTHPFLSLSLSLTLQLRECTVDSRRLVPANLRATDSACLTRKRKGKRERENERLPKSVDRLIPEGGRTLNPARVDVYVRAGVTCFTWVLITQPRLSELCSHR